MSPSSCLVLLSGIPASGKTTLAQLFEELVSTKFPLSVQSTDDVLPRIEVIHIAYDDLIEDNLRLDGTDASWKQYRKQYRKQVRTCVDQVLHYLTEGVPLGEIVWKLREDCQNGNSLRENESEIYNKFCDLLSQQSEQTGPGNPPSNNDDPTVTIIILDDNFFYRSMRYEYFQLARKYSVGFCEVYVHCPVAVASFRNSHRPSPISEGTYANMMEKIEEPCHDKAPWETDYIIVDGGSEFAHLELSEMWGLVVDNLQNPVQPLEEEDLEAKEESRAVSLKSTLHQADIILRKCVSESIKSKKPSTGVGSFDVKRWAAKANDTRNAVLDMIREGAITLPPPYQDGASVELGVSTPNKKFEGEIKRLYGEAIL